MKKILIAATIGTMTLVAQTNAQSPTQSNTLPAPEVRNLPAAVEVGDIVEVASGAGSFGTLVAAVQAAGLVDTLKGTGPFTVFAPTDAAFQKLGAEKIADLLKPENKELLTKILTYHVVPGTVMAADVKPGQVTTVEGSAITVKAEGGKVMVNNAVVEKTDIVASNGVIHVIDTVIMPPKKGY